MIDKYLKYGLRKMWKNKLFSVINLLGLAIGIASFLMLFLYTSNEKSYDRHFSKARQIYRVSSIPVGSDNMRWARSLGIVHEAAKSIPEVEDATWFSHAPAGTIRIGNRQFQQKDILSVDQSFINLFEVKPVCGNLSEIVAPNAAFVSERFAQKYFKGENPVGKMIDIESLQYQRNLGNYEIRGVIENTHPKTHFNYEILLSQNGALSERYASLQDNKTQWIYNYLLLKEGANPEIIADALHGKFIESSLPQTIGPKDYQFSLTPLTHIHLRSNDQFELKENSSKINMGLIVSISFLIVLITLFNFTNLSIAKLIKQSKEFNMKKSLGATTSQLIFQHLTEVFIMCSFAIILSFGLIELFKPFFPKLFNIEFAVYYKELIVYATLVFVLASCLFIMALFALPILHKKNSSPTQNRAVNKALLPLLIAQLAMVIVLISTTLLVNKQIRYILSRTLGYDKEQVVVLHLNDFYKDPSVFADKLKKQSWVESLGFTMQYFGYPSQSMSLDHFGLDGNTELIFANYDYIKTMKLQLVENWIKPSVDTVRGMLVNEHLYKRLMEKHGSMEALQFYQSSQNLEEGQSRINFLGVIQDFNYSSAHDAIGDFAFWLDETRNRARFIHVRLTQGNPHTVMKKIEAIWSELFPGQEFNYFFLDDQIAAQYKAETILSRILAAFSLLAVLIAMFGIGAFSLFVSQLRTKEIGIRKVNGARISEVLVMLNRDFVKWVAIAFVIATPIAWYVMNKWLQNFAYKTTLSWWIFVLPVLLVLLIALLVVSWQTWKAATRNPVEALRYE